MSKKYFIHTFGCQMNVHDSEKIAGMFSASGYNVAEGAKDADVIVLNTCSIRQKAEQKFYSELGRMKLLKRINPMLKIAVAGCIAQQKGYPLIRKFPYVDFIFGPGNLDSLRKWIDDGIPRKVPPRGGRSIEHGTLTTALKHDPAHETEEFPVKREGQVRAWVSIMFGCNNFCSYCIVPYTRGREISRPSSGILSEIKDLCDRGYKEVTLLGQNVNSYRNDIDFTELLRRIDSTGINRVRFVTSHPRDFSLELINAIADLPGVCEHVHLPIQSASDRILDLMNRRYSYKDYIEKINMLREKVPDIAVTADVIVGFPGENEEDHLLTINAIKEIGFDSLFAFKFSPRQGTKAYDMDDDVPEEVKSERLNNLLRMQDEITLTKNLTLEGTVQEILIEGHSGKDLNMLTGRTRTNKIVTIPDANEPEGTLVNVKIRKARQHSLEAVKV